MRIENYIFYLGLIGLAYYIYKIRNKENETNYKLSNKTSVVGVRG